MKVLPVFVKKITTIIQAAGGANFKGIINPAIRLTTQLRGVVPQKPATKLTLSPITAKVTEKPATKLTMSPITQSGTKVTAGTKQTNVLTAKAPENPATKLTLAPIRATALEKPASKILQIRFDLTHKSNVVTAAVDAGATGTWNNPTNIQGPRDAAVATFSGGLVLGTGKLRGTAMVAQPNRPATLLIDSVSLRYYYKTAGIPAVSDLISSLAVGFRINTSPIAGVDKDVHSVSAGNEDFLVAGNSFRIDDGAGKFIDGASPAVSTAVTWANIALLQPYLNASTIANGLMTYTADAIDLTVVAHEVEIP